MNRKRYALFAQAHEDLMPAESFWDMATLLHEALEEVRVLSANLREESVATRTRAAALREHSMHLHQRSAQAQHTCDLFAAPPPEAIQHAESQLLAIFKHGLVKPDGHH